MNIQTNQTFDSLLAELEFNGKFQEIIPLSQYLQDLLSDRIIVNQYGIGLSSLYTPNNSPSNYDQSYYEDDGNHFHVSDELLDDRTVFIQGIIMTNLLALRFKKEGLKGIRVWFSFQSKDMAIEWAKEYGIYDKHDFHAMNDRISFYLMRQHTVVIPEQDINSVTSAALITIDI